MKKYKIKKNDDGTFRLVKVTQQDVPLPVPAATLAKQEIKKRLKK